MSIFTDEPLRMPSSSVFNLSHEVKASLKFGQLTPILSAECFPGDKWKFSTEQFIRFAPLLSPVMHRMNGFVHYFFVPNRIIWNGWKDFIAPNGLPDEERPEKPMFIFHGFNHNISEVDRQKIWDELTKLGTLLDYMYVNIQHLNGVEYTQLPVDGSIKFDLLPFLAYHRIFCDYYCDENFGGLDDYEKLLARFANRTTVILSDELTLQRTEETPENDLTWQDLFLLFRCDLRAFEKDYFTSALPDTQVGAEVTIGAGGTLPNMVAQTNGLTTISGRLERMNGQPLSTANYPTYVVNSPNEGDANLHAIDDNMVINQQVRILGSVSGENARVTAEDGSEPEINPVTINELRRAIKLQEFLEKSMRGGKRLIEQIRSHFGVVSSDARLDRPEFIGGNMSPVTISEISATAASSDNTLGEYSGHATQFGNTKRRKYFCEEHGWLFCIYSCLPRTAYCQGIPRQFMRQDRFDYPWPEFTHLGEQEVKNSELYVGLSDNDKVFGYQSRYADIKTMPSRICGDFRKSLDYWTMTRIFANRPTLSKTFIECSPEDENLNRIFTVVQDEHDYLYGSFFHNIVCRRKFSKYGTPML